MRRLLQIAAAGMALLAPAVARAAATADYQCAGDVTYRRALAVRNLVRDFNDADAMLRDDVDHSMALAHGSPWRVGVQGEGALLTIPSFPCEPDVVPLSQSLSSTMGAEQAIFYDTDNHLELRAFRLDVVDTLATGTPYRNGVFQIGSQSRSAALTGGVVRWDWVEVVGAYQQGRGGYARLGSPRLGLAFDALLPEKTQPDYRMDADQLYDAGHFLVGAAAEHRASDHLSWVEPRVFVGARENESRAGLYASAAESILPGGFQAATMGLEFNGRGLSPEDAPVMQAHLRAFVEGTVFDLARASHPGPALPHSLVGGFATGLGVALGGSVASFGFDVRGGVNRPALLRDLPSAHGHGDVALVGFLRITPPIPRRGRPPVDPSAPPPPPDGPGPAP